MSPVEEGTLPPETHAARIPISSRVQSPTYNPFPLGSNDDELERAQARAARAASIRRKSVVTEAAPTSLPSLPSLLERDQIMDLLQNCLKLASENKINQKNTWELNLIDHLSEIIQSKSEDDDSENNFQKASCSLEAGVKIYSLRVDSLHSEAYKVLGGINRAGTEENHENAADKKHAHGRIEQEDGLSRKDIERKLSPLSTLEASFEALNIKKFDVAFSVDPLYHQTSAQFDEGGAKGLLLNNLGVYGNCLVLFDSFEVPEKFILNDSQNDKSELIDLSFSKDCLDLMMINMPKKNDISPTLRDIMDQFDENNHKQQNLNSVEEPVGHGETEDIYRTQLGDTSFGDVDLNNSDHDDHVSVIDDNSMIGETSFSSHLEETGDYSFQGFGSSAKIEEITDFLSYGLGFTSKTNEWAGPDYWKYKKSKGLEHVPYSVEKQEQTTSKTKVKKSISDIEFTKSLEKDFSNIFEAPKNPKSLLLPTNRASCKFTLPEDFHYKPESLAKLFLLPDVMFLGKKARKSNVVADLREPNDDFAPASWDQESINDDNCDDENSNDDINNPGNLVRLPRQVNKVEVQYDKVSKQVDVHALKEKLWKHIHVTVDRQLQQQEGWEDSDSNLDSVSISLRQVLNQLQQSDNSRQDISPHLFFICLLHLANEHGLTLLHSLDLDDVAIAVPQPSSFAT